MPLNIKDPITERLATEVARLTGESKTGAIRTALVERKHRLLLARGGRERGDRMVDLLRDQVWPDLPVGVRGRTVTKAEEDAVLGFGPDGA
jgi:antitoxin VapB